MNVYYKILNEIASAFDMDQWDEQVNLFTDVIDKQLNSFVHNTKYNWIYILNNNFPQFDFYKERCYVNSEKVILDELGTTENEWDDQETVKVIIKDLDQLGESCKSMFHRCHSLVSVPIFNTSRVTDMTSMFYECEFLVSVPLFDTSKVTNMDEMFNGCKSLVSVPLFDTSSVTSMFSMFAWCKSLESVPLFDTSSVTGMFSMFAWCESLVSVPKFDTSRVVNMNGMFIKCHSLSEKTKQDWSSVYNFRTNEML